MSGGSVRNFKLERGERGRLYYNISLNLSISQQKLNFSYFENLIKIVDVKKDDPLSS